MVHKHGRGKAIRKRMSRIMKAANILSKQLPTKRAREEQEIKEKEAAKV